MTEGMKHIEAAVFGLILITTLTLVGVGSAGAAGTAIDWNENAIKWQGYYVGLENARRNARPVLLLIYADW